MLDQKQREYTAALNDAVRRLGWNWVLTPGIRALADMDEVLSIVRRYERFDYDNDPYGEHDFGRFEHNGSKIFWKIDYYDKDLRYWSDPFNNNTRRILTVMLVKEY